MSWFDLISDDTVSPINTSVLLKSDYYYLDFDRRLHVILTSFKRNRFDETEWRFEKNVQYKPIHHRYAF